MKLSDHPRLRHRMMLLILVLIGINMRPLLTSIGPLLPEVRAATGMSYAVASLLTALPIVAMGAMSLAGNGLSGRISERKNIALSLLMIIIGAGLRESSPQSALLLSSALLGGIGIGIIQVIIPTLIKRLFPRHMPQVMGLWSAALMGGGGLGAILTPWIARHSEQWHHALAGWALPAAIALAGWWLISRSLTPPARRAAEDGIRISRHPRAWTLGLYFGAINGGYASLIAWLPPYYIQLGKSAQFSGTLLALMTAGQTVGALLLPMLARQSDRRMLLFLALAAQLVGFIGFIYWPFSLSILWAVLCGIGLGGAFPLCLVLALDHSPHPEISARLVAFMQGTGFILAGLSPWLSGLLRTLSGNYLADWIFHALCVAGLMLLTRRFTPRHYPHAWRIKQ